MVISPRFGGRCWLVKSSIEVVQCDFLNESISILKFKINNRYVCVIGVYLPYDDSKQNSYAQYSSLLLCLGELVRDLISENFSVIIGGDFNADISRGKRFDVLLQRFIEDENFHMLDSNLGGYSYLKGNYRAFIDHSLVPRQDDPLDFNTSDHNALHVSCHFPGEERLIIRLEVYHFAKVFESPFV